MRVRYAPLLISFLLAACSSNNDDVDLVPPEEVPTDDAGTDVETDSGTDAETDAGPDAEPEAGPTSFCGDGVLDEGEACDLGEDNADDGNCRLDCTWAEEQHWVVSAAEVQENLPFDGRGVTIAGAPAGEGAWGTASEDLNGDGLIKFELYLDPTHEPFAILGTVTLADIDEIAYHTTKPGKQNSHDYSLVLYTKKLEETTSTTFYEHKLSAAPKNSRNLDAPEDTWVRWSTKVGPNQLAFTDEPTSGSYNTAATLEELTADKFDWQSVVSTAPETAIDYASQEILFFSIQTDSGKTTSEFEGLLDKVSVTLKDGRKATVDLEP